MKRINLKKINFDNIRNKVNEFFLKHKLISMGIFTFALLACVTFLISYAYYKITDEEPIISTQIGEIPDIDIRILVEDRKDDGSAIKGKYIEYPYVPQAGYKYNAEESYCTNGSELKFSEADHNLTVDTEGIETCFAYFDSIANLDIVLNVEIEETDESGKGLQKYKRIDSTEMPAIGYTLASSKCTNNATVSYNLDENRFVILTDSKTVCDVRMDAIPADVILKLKVQEEMNSANYLEVEELSANQYYVLNNQTTCTNGATATIENQEVVVKTTKPTVCTVFLDLSAGPIPESAMITNANGNTLLNVTASKVGTPVNNWYYSVDNGLNYQPLNDGVVANYINNPLMVYGEDATGNKTSLIEVDKDNNYYYGGYFTAQDEVYEKTIEKEGYYYLQAWGASEDNNYNLGSYAEGYVYLKVNDKLYISVGKMPSGDTTIKLNNNADGYQLLSVGGANSNYIFAEGVALPDSGLNQNYYLNKGLTFNKYEIFEAINGTEETGHNGDGYVKVSYIGTTLEE